jgi:glycerophosphoryl diester phosphodiesterase
MLPFIIAHRGASADAPENTAAAFETAIAQGADMVEFDVRWSAEGTPVVMHDLTVERTTGGTGAVAAMRLEEIRGLDAGSWFGRRFRGERVLTLEEALAILGPRIRMNIELCADAAPPAGFAARMMRLVEGARLPEPPIFSSFDFSFLTALRAENHETRIAPLFRAAGPGPLARALSLRPTAVHPRRTLVTPAFMRRLRAAAVPAHAWTVNRSAEARRLLRLGVNGIFTDHPARMLRVRMEAADGVGERARRRADSKKGGGRRRR